MAKFHYITGNVKHNGVTYAQGTAVEATEATAPLVEIELAVVIEAENEAEAIALGAEQTAVPAAVVEEPEPEGTFGPFPDQNEKAPAAPQEPEVTIGKFIFMQDFEVTNKDSKNYGQHKRGDVIEADVVAAQDLIDQGILIVADNHLEVGSNVANQDTKPTDDGANL